MRRVLSLLAVVALVAGFQSLAGTQDEAAYGAKLTLEKSTAIEQILDNPEQFADRLVRIEGKISEMCTSQGCWLRVAAGDGRSLLAKSTGDKVTIPTDSAGRTAIVEGKVIVEEVPAHEHEDEGHACPTASVRMETAGVVLR